MHPQIVEFTRAYLVVITKVLVPSGAIVVLTRTPVIVNEKTTHGGLVEEQLVQLILGGQIPVAVTV